MKDRVPLYPGRVKLTPVSGHANTYDMVRADDPAQEGTPLNKSTFLKDTTAALYGLGANAVPDDVFLTLSGCLAQILVTTLPNTEVTASLNGKTVSATSDSSGLAVFKILSYGTWTVSASIHGSVVSKNCEIKAIAQYKVFLLSDLNSTSWDVISSVSDSGDAAYAWSVGDKKTININGTDYQFQIIGFNHDTKTAGGTAGITFQMVNCLATKNYMEASNTNANGWEGCFMRKTMLNSTIYGQLNSDLKAVIKAVNKVSSVGNNSSGLETTSDKLFLLSEIEIFGSTTYSFAGEGKQYEYYAAGNSAIKTVNGSYAVWWMRSPYSGNTSNFCCVDPNGSSQHAVASSYHSVSFGFCV